jgi:hypothetical protein
LLFCDWAWVQIFWPLFSHYFNPLCLNRKILSHELNAPQQLNGKTLSLSAMGYRKFSAFIVTHLFFTIYVWKACTDIKDCDV